ncbi:efflux RND transporter periplasmic adaptor subunit [Dokdonella sp.]|uniref:efflux RND transporter periplasmic adaptor subunit n=1 Tax=Dokdonella sp. TaxID=2291710 RepID=UPI0025C57587|nr:efflux RND transporter periplasmic adaptor subunit [Dokdonella sp.]MBX3688929.1 efflux RND transporter periplasmic adaptor subunit [Dokdonella sp.]
MKTRDFISRLPGFGSLARSLVGVALALALAACSTGNSTPVAGAADASSAIPVETATVSQQSITANYSGTASLEAVGEAQVVAKASGIVLKLLVEEGMYVKRGQLLAQLDDDAASNKLAQATANLRKAQASYDKAEKGFALKITPKADYDSMRYDLEAQKAIVAGAQLDVSYTRILAPIDGVIAKRSVKVGNLVQINQALFDIVDLDRLQAVLNVPERDLDTLKAGQSVVMQVDALGGRSFEGMIARIAPVIDAASGTFRATCEFRDTTRTLKPGMFGRIEVAYDQRHDALVVPRNAITEEDGETSVFVVEPAPATAPAVAGKSAPAKEPAPRFVAKRRVVKLGYAEDDRVEVRDGIHQGERVITLGRNAVRDGTQVQVLADGKAALAATATAQLAGLHR